MCKHIWNDITGKNAAKAAQNAQNAAQANATAQHQQQSAIAQEAINTQRKQFDEQQAAIRNNTGLIDNTFAQFDDSYFARAADDYTAGYIPDLTQQLEKARDTLKAQLAAKGMLESSVGADKFGALEETAARARSDVAAKGQDFAQNLRGRVNATKAQLYNAAQSAADPNSLAARAAGEASAIAQAPNTPAAPSIGNLFGDLLAPAAAAFTANANRRKGGAFGLAPTTGAGSSQVTG